MSRGFAKRGTLTREIILVIATLGALTIAASSPYFLHKLVRQYFKEKSKEIVRARAKKLRELEKRKLVSFKELGNGTVRIELTHKGKLLVRQYNVEDIKLTKPAKWDGQWRILIYDIPVRQKRASNAFREKLKQLGLFPLQRSVWISPYECLPEVEFLTTVFEIDINRCICYFSAKNIPREREVRKFFNL